MRRISAILAIIVIFISFTGLLAACAAKDPTVPVTKGFAQGLGDMSRATLNGLQNEVQRIDNELATVETRLLKMEQVAPGRYQGEFDAKDSGS